MKINQAQKIKPIIIKNLLNFFIIIGIFLFYSYIQTQHKTELEIQAYISDGQFMEVYLNEEWHQPFKLPIIKGKINNYKLVDVPPNLKSIRIDPTDRGSVEFKIIDISLKSLEQTISISKEFPIQDWSNSGIECKNQKCQSVSDDPILSQKINVKLNNGLTYSIKQILANNTFQLLLIILLTTFSFLVNNGLYKIVILFSLVLISNLFFKLLLTHVPELIKLKLPVNEVIGVASYYGLNIPNDIFYFNSIILFSTFFYIIIRKFFKIDLFNEVTNLYPLKPIDYLYSFIFGILFFILVSPHFWWLSGFSLGPYMSDFDSQNIVSWGYMVAKQYLPYRDFWFPYSLYAYLQPPIFPNDLFKSLHSLIIYLVIQQSLLKIYNGNIKKLVLTIVFFYSINLIYLPVGTDRYFLGFSLLLFFYAYLLNPSVLLGIIFGFYLAYCSLFELNQVIYFVPSGMVILIGAYLSKSVPNLKKLFSSIIIPLLVFSLLAVFILALAIEFDIFSGYVSLFRAMSKMYLYGLWPTDYSLWVFQLSKEGLWLFCILIFMAISILGFKKRVFFSYLIVAFFLLQIVIFQKQLLRPHVANELLIFPIMMLFITFCYGNFLQNEKKSILKGLPIYIMIGLISSNLYFNSSLVDIFLGKLKSFNRVVANVLYINKNYTESRDKYFSKNNFYINGIQSEDFRNNFLRYFPIDKKNDVYVLGDESYLYIALEQNFPPHINFYNQSIISLQKESIDWITRNNPKYVIWDANFQDFDRVPNFLRVPLIFNFIQERYHPDSTIDKFQVLVRNRDSEVLFSNLKFWSDHLGRNINFRNLTRLSSLNKELNCNNETNAPLENSNFLLISAPKIHLPNEVKINFKIPGNLFTISFIAGDHSHSGNYVIPLSSIWFYKFLYRESGLELTSPDNGISIKFCNDAAGSNVLY